MGSRRAGAGGKAPANPSVSSPKERLRGLLDASRAMIASSDVSVLLPALVAESRELVEARCAAVSVATPDGRIEQFAHLGGDVLSDPIVQSPAGRRLVSELTTGTKAIRWRSGSACPSAAGMPDEDPGVGSFLGVPIRIRGRVFAVLYLTDATSGEFSADDEDLVSALAATAAVVIENIWLFDESRLRQKWLKACAEIAGQLLSDVDGDPLRLIAQRVLENAHSDLVNVVLPAHGKTMLVVEVAAGEGARQLAGRRFPMARTLSSLAIHTGRAVSVAALSDLSEQSEYGTALCGAVSLGPVMAIPLSDSLDRGALIVGRLDGRPSFSDADLTMATVFAAYAAVGLELAEARRRQQHATLLEDRSRIARDLHDHVIQRLYAAGLTVQSVAATVLDPHTAERLSDVIDETDAIIDHIRTAISALRTPHV